MGPRLRGDDACLCNLPMIGRSAGQDEASVAVAAVGIAARPHLQIDARMAIRPAGFVAVAHRAGGGDVEDFGRRDQVHRHRV